VVPFGNAEAIKTAIKQLQNDAGLRRTLGANGRQAYETQYSWKIMRQRLLNAYGKMAGSV
jgi:glycosyltransferase involved in cell wall biosynthesis